MAILTDFRLWALTAGVLIVASSRVAAQTSVLPPTAATDAVVSVSVDLAAGAFDRALPFDVPFFITGRAPGGTQAIAVQYAIIPRSGDTSNLVWAPQDPDRWRPVSPTAADQPFLILIRTPLEAGRRYRFRFQIENQSPAAPIPVEGRTARTNHVSADVGMLYAGDIATGALYVGTNIYFRPVNRNAPLTDAGSIGRRLALTVGVTVSSVADKDNRTRSDLFWNQSLVLGGGYRLTSAIRGGGGALVFLESDPNPLISRRTIASTWYVSFSFDLDVAGIFR